MGEETKARGRHARERTRAWTRARAASGATRPRLSIVSEGMSRAKSATIKLSNRKTQKTTKHKMKQKPQTTLLEPKTNEKDRIKSINKTIKQSHQPASQPTK